MKPYYVLFFIHCKTRKVILAGVTPNPNETWMAQQARNICMRMQDEPIKPRIILHDRDTKYSEKYRRLLKSEGIKPFRLPVQSPNLHAFAERWVKTVKEECLDHFVVVGEKRLNHLLHEYVDY